MTHPEELLADYVDGAIGDDERAVVDAHLRACATCREEVLLSRAAVTALRALEEEPVPLGVTGPVLAEAGRRFERRRSALWSRVQWAAGAAAAAALVLVVVVNLGGPGTGQDAADRAGAGADSATAQDGGEEAAVAAEAALPGLEVQGGVSYDGAGVRSLAEVTAERERTGEDTLAAPDSAPAPDGFREPSAALDCLRTSGAPVDEPTTDTLVRLIQARYEGTPAYFAVFLESPGAGQPPDTVVVWVTARDDCTRFLDAASQAI
jgi:anti-sigma factor RsiW